MLSVDGFSGLLKGPGRRAGNRRGRNRIVFRIYVMPVLRKLSCSSMPSGFSLPST